jgi:LemA protein
MNKNIYCAVERPHNFFCLEFAMKKNVVIIFVVLLAIALFYGYRTYNKLVAGEESIKKLSADLQVNYQRRLDLIPNLVSVVKGASAFEQETLVKVVEMRSKAQQALTVDGNTEAMEKTQAELATTTNQLIATIEKYPELSSTESYKGLQRQLEGTENRIRYGRKDFNEAVMTYNQLVRQIPSKWVAGLTGFKENPAFVASAGASTVPEIKFTK